MDLGEILSQADEPVAQEDPRIAELKPVATVFVLSDGRRVPFSMRFRERTTRDNAAGMPTTFWVYEPVIEGDVAKLMPMVCSIDADLWHPEAAIFMPSLQSGGMTRAWCERVISNSECLKTIGFQGKTWRKP